MPPARFFPARFPLVVLVLLVALLATGSLAWLFDRSDSPTAALPPLPGDPPSTPGASTPTSRPADLPTAQKLVRAGEFEAAIDALGQIVGSVDPVIDAEARLLQSEVWLETGQNRRALEALDDLRRRYPDREQATLALFFIGQGRAAIGEQRQAAEVYRTFAEAWPAAAHYAQLLAAQSLRHAGDLDAAQRTAEAVAAEPTIPRTTVDALELIQAIQEQREDQPGVVQTTSRLLELATLPLYRAELFFERGSARRTLGDDEAAASDFVSLVLNTPESPYALPALQALDELDRAEGLLREQRALVQFYGGEYDAAVELLSEALEVNPASSLAWYYRALARLQLGEAAGSTELRELPDRFANSRFVTPALLAFGGAQETAGQVDRAAEAYQLLLERRPDAPEAGDARFRLGMLRYRQGDPRGAADVWAGDPDRERPSARLNFWLGKALTALGDSSAARRAWDAAEAADPRGFYGRRASELNDGQSDVRMDRSVFDPTTLEAQPADRTELEAWYRELGTSRQASRERLEREPAFATIAGLLRLGLDTQAGWEIDALIERLADDPADLASLATLLVELNETAASYRVAGRLDGLALERGIELPPAVARLLYPFPYPELIQREAAAHELDPLLLLALIRQESAFDSDARSWVGARGLTQVMPETGAAIAGALDIRPWAADDLHRPAVGVRFGAFYLSERLTGYDGSIYPALAGYNAGDGNAGTWVQRYGLDDPDLYVERIPFPETHDYVKRVYANYLTYQRLYS